MKTLKKTLCLVLAVVMVVGVLVVPAAADFNDADKIVHKDAVNVLNKLHVIAGKEDGSNFAPADTLSRAEAAKLAAYAAMGETKAELLSTDAVKFTDVATNYWANKYIGWAYDQGIIAGRGNGKFDPEANVTGYELARIMLSTMGVKGVYTGDTWANGVMQNALDVKLTAELTEEDLNKAITRDDAAQMVFNAITWESPEDLWYKVSMKGVDEPLYFGPSEVIAAATKASYSADVAVPGDITVERVASGYTTLGAQTFGLSIDASSTDVYGRPRVHYAATAPSMTHDVPAKNTVFTKPTAECDIAEALGLSKLTKVVEYIWGEANDVKVDVDPLKTSTLFNQPGEVVETYADEGVIVSYVPLLAKVTSVTTKVTDRNGHVIVAPEATFSIYDGTDIAKDINGNLESDGTLRGTTFTHGAVRYTVKLDNADGTYAKGDIYEVHYLTVYTNKATGATTTKLIPIQKLTPVTVTIAALVEGNEIDTDNTKIKVTNGIIDTAGNQYLYNCCMSAVDHTNADLGKTVKLYLDSNGYVMDWAYTSVETITGVVTGIDSVKISTAKYAAEVELLTGDGVKTIYVLNNGKTFDANLTGLNIGTDELYTFVVDSDNASYYDYEDKGVLASLKDNGVIYSGDAEAVIDEVLDDDSVFFVARYSTNNKTHGYEFYDYAIINGFKNIPDLAVDPRTTILDSSSTTATYQPNLVVTKLDGNYLVKYAASQTDNETELVPSYAYLQTNNKFVDLYNGYVTFHALVNGAPQDLVVTQASADGIKETGMYTYKAGTYASTLTPVDYFVAGDHYSYDAGVLTIDSTFAARPTVWTDSFNRVVEKHHLTVSDNVKIYLVDEQTNNCAEATLDILEVYDDCDIYYQYDALGYIGLIYVINTKHTGTSVAPASPEISSINNLYYDKTNSCFRINITTKNVDLTDGTYKVTVVITKSGYQVNKYTYELTGVNAPDADGATKLDIFSEENVGEGGSGVYNISITIKGTTAAGKAVSISKTATLALG